MVLNLFIPIFRGINEGFKDGFEAGKIEGHSEGYREGFKSGSEFGTRLAASFIPLIQILRSSSFESSAFVESARKLLFDLKGIPLSNLEDPQKEFRLSQIEAKIKALIVNFKKKVKDSTVEVLNNRNQSHELSF